CSRIRQHPDVSKPVIFGYVITERVTQYADKRYFSILIGYRSATFSHLGNNGKDLGTAVNAHLFHPKTRRRCCRSAARARIIGGGFAIQALSRIRPRKSQNDQNQQEKGRTLEFIFYKTGLEQI